MLVVIGVTKTGVLFNADKLPAFDAETASRVRSDGVPRLYGRSTGTDYDYIRVPDRGSVVFVRQLMARLRNLVLDFDEDVYVPDLVRAGLISHGMWWNEVSRWTPLRMTWVTDYLTVYDREEVTQS